jgi:dihydroorotase
LEAFASHFGADFYGLPRNTETITLVKEEWDVPTHYPFGSAELVPLRAGERIGWHFAEGSLDERS